MASVSRVYLKLYQKLNLNEYQDGIRVWSVSVLYLRSLNLKEYQNGIRIWCISELYLNVESE